MWHVVWNVMAVIGIMCCVSALFVVGWLTIDEISSRRSFKEFQKEVKKND